MQDLKNKVAVITGAAEGIGRAIAVAAAAEGMKLVLADLNAEKLAATVAELSASGADAIGIPTDVANEAAVKAMADQAFSHYGKVHLLVNNAGVGMAKSAWETTQADWDWIMGINLYGVTHALRAFIPRMLEKGEEGHIVNTASMAGLLSAPALAAYNVTKFGVVTLSEGLHHDLALRKSRIKVSVLCPSWVKTRIAESERQREPGERSDFAKLEKVSAMTSLAIMKAVLNGMEPQQVASDVINAVKTEKFYILTHANAKAGVKLRMEDILNDRAPTLMPI